MIPATSFASFPNSRPVSSRSQAAPNSTNVKSPSFADIAEVSNAKMAEKTPAPSLKSEIDWDQYLDYANFNSSQEEFDKKVTEGGKLLSQSQGLPEGHYDFSRMTRKQMNVALNDMIRNQRAPQSVIDGLSQIHTTMPDTPIDMLKEARESIDYETSVDNPVVANLLKSALTYMDSEKALFPPKDATTANKAASYYQSIASQG